VSPFSGFCVKTFRVKRKLVLKQRHCTFDETAHANDGIDGSRHGEEPGCQRKLERTRNFGFEYVAFFDVALLERGLNALAKRVDYCLVPSGFDYADSAL
jgi:hypothetical protein